MFESLAFLPQHRRLRQQEYPLPGVMAIIRHPRPVPTPEASAVYLLIQRHKEPYSGQWALVGGHWEFGELLENAIVREVKEETGMDTSFVAMRGLIIQRIAPQTEAEAGGHYLQFVCEVSVVSGEAIEQSEGQVAWFSREELDAMHAAGRVVASDYALLRLFSRDDLTVPYYELDVIGGASSKIIRFELRT